MVTIHRESVAGFTGGVLSLGTGTLPDRETAMSVMTTCNYDFVECVGRINILDSPFFEVTYSCIIPIQTQTECDMIAIPACNSRNGRPYNGTYVNLHGITQSFGRSTLSMITVKFVYINDKYRDKIALVNPTPEYNKVELFQALRKARNNTEL